MEIFGTFGLDPVLTAAQIVNFLVILYVLKRFVYKPLFNVLQKRQDMVKDSVKNAEESKKALEKAEAKEKELIKEARSNADQILKDAKEQAAVIIKKAEEDTKKQTQQMLKDAKEQIELETAKAQVELNKHVAQLSVELLKKSIDKVFTGKEQGELVDRAVKELRKN
jgi:F-type H+-transporting ATPase subunit b